MYKHSFLLPLQFQKQKMKAQFSSLHFIQVTIIEAFFGVHQFYHLTHKKFVYIQLRSLQSQCPCTLISPFMS